MRPADADDRDEEQFAALLAAYDEALAAGRALPTEPDTPVRGVQARLERARTALSLLERRFPRSSPTPTPTGELPTLPQSAGPPGEQGGSPGQVGRFQVIRELGRGGFGVVFLALDPTLRRPVALKVPRPEVAFSSELRARFLREARAAAGLDHPNVVPVYETGEAGPAGYIVSAYVEGPTLAAWLRERKEPVPARAVASLTARLAEAVEHAHRHGVLHRDLKPGNVLLEPAADGAPGACDGLGFAPRLADFGLAKAVDGGRREGEEEPATATGAVLGTPCYMAPEQAEGRSPEVGAAADVYALGVVLYEVLIGRPPFQGGTDLATLRQVMADEPVAPRRLRPDVPADLEAVCLKCLEKDPKRRYASAADLVADLRRFLAGEPTRARPLGPLGRARKWARRRPAAAALVAVSALALLGVALGVAWHAVQLERINVGLREQTREANRQRALAEETSAQLRRVVYANRFKLAVQAAQGGQLVQAAEALDALRPGPGEEDLRGFEWHHAKGLCHPIHAVWRGHQRGVNALAVSPDGKTVASGGSDQTVRLWDAGTGRTRAVLSGHSKNVNSVTFSPDGQTLLTAAHEPEGDVRLWDLRTAQERARFTMGSGSDTMRFTPDGRQLVAVVPDTVRFWDAATGQAAAYFHEPETMIHCLAIAPDGRTLAVSSGPRTVRLWDVPMGRPRLALHGHRARVESLAFAPDGRLLATGSRDHAVRLWHPANGAPLGALPGHRNPVTSLVFAPDGRMLAAAAPDPSSPASAAGEVRLWDVAAGSLLATIDRHVGNVNALAFLPGGRLLAVACGDHTIKLLDTGAAPATAGLPGHAPKEAWALAFSPDGRTLASAGDDEHVRLWDPATRRERACLQGHRSLVAAVAYSPDGRTLASASYDQTVKLWDAGTGRVRATLAGAADRLRCLAFSPDGRLLAAGGRDSAVRLWDVSTGREDRVLGGHGKTVRAVAFAPDGTTLASASEDGKVRLWDTATWGQRALFDDTDGVGCLAFAPDGRTLATGSKTGIVRLWDAADGRERAALRGHGGEVFALAFAPDGRTLATAGEDQTVRLWQAATGEELLVLTGHARRVNAVAFAPDGTALASADHGGAIRLWRTSPLAPAGRDR